MQLTYTLLLIVANASGGESMFAIDYNLSKADCEEMRFSWLYDMDQDSTVICTEEQD